eukprot:1179191-Prorocentrum_minimum.AAC.5
MQTQAVGVRQNRNPDHQVSAIHPPYARRLRGEAVPDGRDSVDRQRSNSKDKPAVPYWWPSKHQAGVSVSRLSLLAAALPAIAAAAGGDLQRHL